MMLLVMHENPCEAAKLVPNKYKHKQLLELMQMISCVVDFGYKQIPQGKEIKEWIKRNIDWTYVYAKVLMRNVKLKEETGRKYSCLLDLLELKCSNSRIVPNATTAIWRYNKDYESDYPTNTELPIKIVIDLYKKYIIEFKKESVLWTKTN